MRALLILACLLLVVMALSRLPSALKGRLPAAPPRRDELVKDPVCQTYVVRSRAVRRPGRDGTHYFCSSACAKRYLPS